MADRFYVSSITGYTIDPETTGGQRLTTSYRVADRDYCHRDVAVFAVIKRGMPRSSLLKARAEALCARLNTEYGDE